MDLPKRKHPLARCEDCDLQKIGRFVPSEGPNVADIAFIGEAPGRNEALDGRPFTGESGKLLTAVMKHHGMERKDVLLTNACLCRPPDNATPSKRAIDACRPRLIAELEERGIETAVTLGNSASIAVLGKGGITTLRVGAAKDGTASTGIQGLKVVPTFHPAAALRSPDMFPHIVTDVGKVHIEYGVWNPPTYDVVDDIVEALGWIRRLSDDPGVTDLVLDIEVDIEKDVAFDHPNQYRMLCVGIGYAKGKVLVFTGSVLETESVRDRLKQLLNSRKLTAQNGKFDLAGLFPLLGGLKLHFDTMLASYVFDERTGGIHGLKYQAVEILGAPQYDLEIKKYVGRGDGYGVIPADILYRYNAFDVSCTWDLKEYYEAKFARAPDLRKVHDFLIAVSNELMYVELNGIAVDKGYLDTLTQKYLKSLGDLEVALDNVVMESKNPNREYDSKKDYGINARSPKQVTAYLSDRGVRVESTNVATLTEVLDYFAKKGKRDHEVFRFVETLLRHRREAKLYGTYVKGIRTRLYGGRVFPTFLLHGTTTGRPACRNPNLLNIPRESAIRRLFVPHKPGFVFVSTDYAQAELRMLCFLASDDYFRQLFNQDERDPFEELTSVLYPGITKAVVGAEKWKDMRVRVKAFVYGLNYGRTEFSIAQEFKLPVREAEALAKRFFAVIPEIVEFQRRVKRDVMQGKDLITPWGRRRRFMLVTPSTWKDISREALAFKPQSTASDACLDAFTSIRPQLKGLGWVRNVIYDAILAECRKEDVEEVTQIIESEMLKSAYKVVGDYVKFKVETDVGLSWGDV